MGWAARANNSRAFAESCGFKKPVAVSKKAERDKKRIAMPLLATIMLFAGITTRPSPKAAK